MDTNIDEIYAVFGELVAVQGISMKRLQRQVAESERQVAELDERLMLAQRHIKKLEGTDDALGQPSLNDHQGREVPLAEGGGQTRTSELPEMASIPGDSSDER